MRTVAALVVLAACAAVVVSAGSAAPLQLPRSLHISSIEAKFDPADRLTRYWVARSETGASETLTVTWTLTLELVDRAGAPDPNTPDSGAAVDLGCDNNGVGTHTPQKTQVSNFDHTPVFIWHHPDADASIPPGRYHCNHADMGPHGHQGLIKVVVADTHWVCTATYKGTLSSAGSPVVRNGTASASKCSKSG